jgi:hypothetical protein
MEVMVKVEDLKTASTAACIVDIAKSLCSTTATHTG